MTRRTMKAKKAFPLIIFIILISPLFFVPQPVYAGPLRDYATFINAFKALANAYPELMTYETIGKTVENRDIIMFKIGNPTGGKVLFDGAMHGSESLGSELLYFYAKWLLTSSDPLAKRILARDYTLLIPVVNVDSYDRYIRKNANGVDLNRNFATNWQYAGSSDPNSDYYRGPSPLSEPESKAIVGVFQKYKPSFYVNLHRGGVIFYVNSYGNRTYYSIIFNKITSLAQERGVSTYPYQYISSAGYAISDATSAKITSFLLELYDWSTISLSQIETVLLPKFIPSAMVMSQECESKSLFSDGFESGSSSAWSGTTVTSGDNVAVVNSNPFRGTYSAKFETTGVASGIKCASVYKTIPETPLIYTRGYFYITQGLPLTDNDDYIALTQYLNPDGNVICSLQIRKIQGQNVFHLSGISGTTAWIHESTYDILPQANRWYGIELYAYIHATAGAYKIYIDGTEQITATNLNTTRYGNITTICFGLASCSNTQQKIVTYGDCAEISTNYIEFLNRADINGDGVVNIKDVTLLTLAWLSTSDSPQYDWRCDLNSDGIINIVDATILCKAL
ncbi:hypothetical protein HM002_08015 [Candidatus Bathyarchaeota archaeon A05DMB-4]|nr:hypothetical protein [Candidatus Bathyarchaeota archaeon A05DMB-4]MDH7596079.1 M14 family zinc carboxypeptidase [Candidatus Bathyarchaeota archaeon]